MSCQWNRWTPHGLDLRKCVIEPPTKEVFISFEYGREVKRELWRVGVICRFAVVSAHEHDVTVARCLLADTTALVTGDKGYAGSQVYAQPKNNELHPKVWTSALGWLRKSIESVFSSLLRSKHLLTSQLNSFWSVRASICRKVAAHNLAWFLTH